MNNNGYFDYPAILHRLSIKKPEAAGQLQTLLADEPEGRAFLEAMAHSDPTTPQKPRFTVYSATDALEPQPPIDWIIESLFSAGSVSAIYGEGGSKKTYAMLDAAVCVAIGAQWLDLATSKSAVLIVDEESGRRRLSRRLGDVLRGHMADVAAISLDNDLGPNRERRGSIFDPGEGRDVGDFLPTCSSTCPVLIHSSNSLAAQSLELMLSHAGWATVRVVPFDDLAWIAAVWVPELRACLGGKPPR